MFIVCYLTEEVMAEPQIKVKGDLDIQQKPATLSPQSPSSNIIFIQKTDMSGPLVTFQGSNTFHSLELQEAKSSAPMENTA